MSAPPPALVRDLDDPTTPYLATTASRHAHIIYAEALDEAPAESITPARNP